MTQSKHPLWATAHKKPGTELKCIKGRYYLYEVKSVYDKTIKRSRKISLGILGTISEEQGFVPSQRRKPHNVNRKANLDNPLFVYEYGMPKWLMDTLAEDVIPDLKTHFGNLWQFIVAMVYCRLAHQSPLKNVPFYLQQSDMLNLLQWNEKLYDQKISDLLFELGSKQDQIHSFLKPKDQTQRTVLIDATDITLQSNHIALAQKGYNSAMDFQSQFVLLYLYDAQSLKPLYYRMLPGNIREVSAMQNTIKMSGLEECVYIADKGFFSESNITQLEALGMRYIIPLKRDNALIPYQQLDDVEQTDAYFPFNSGRNSQRFLFYAHAEDTPNKRSITLFLDGKLKEQEKVDYLTRIQTLPEQYTKARFNQKLQTMGTLALIHNTELNPQTLYCEYKNRGEIEQLFDQLKNTLDADCSHMQRQESLNGWMFINHLSLLVIYKLYAILKNTPLNKTQKLNHKYSIRDAIEHLKAIKKIQFNPNEYVINELNKTTKTLISKMKISIT